MRILIAEDDAVSRAVLEKTLLGWGHDVIVTCDGAAAWKELVAEEPPHLAILDWMMPGMDGPDVCRKVRQELPLANMYLLLVTAR